jgi:hypothetical protein
MIGLIDVTLEQSFPPGNSIRKVVCCVLLSQVAFWWGCDQTQHFRQTPVELRLRSNCDSRINCMGWNCRKVRYMIGPIDAILEQSFPPRNSIRKVGFYVLQHVVWWGCHPTRHFRQTQAELRPSRIVTAEYSRSNCIGWNCRKVKYMIGPIDATLEQSFPAWNSIRKVGCYVLQHVVWWGCNQTQHFRQAQSKLQRQSYSLDSIA